MRSLNMRVWGSAALVSASVLALSTATAVAQTCPAATLADPMGVEFAHDGQLELAAFEAAAGCTLTFAENPVIADLNARIIGNPADLPPVADRLPAEPLVIAPYTEIGQYGGVLDGLSNATEAGTSDLLSVRHVNLVRFDDSLGSIVPNVATGWDWNDDFTVLTLTLREGHKWSDGHPFTAHDIAFWYNDMVMNQNIIESPRDIWLAGGQPMLVEALDDTTVQFSLAAPKPGLLATFATDFAQPFQPRHFLGQFHPDVNPDADALAAAAGFESGYEVINFYYGASDWKDVPSPLLKDESRIADLPAAVVPTLEAFITVEDTTEGRRVVANPFFHMVDTAGNQLPYINEINELYVSDNEVRLLMLVNGDVDYKSQSLGLPDAPTMLDGQEGGNYTVELRPQISMSVIAFNVTVEDEARRALYNDIEFRRAVSHAINREEINSVAFFDLGSIEQYIGFDPIPGFATEEQVSAFTAFDPDAAIATFDSLGFVDVDGDGFRELPNGDTYTLSINFSTQGVSATVVELLTQQFRDVGINASMREVTSDEYRAAQSANELDMHIWTKGQPVPVLLGNPEIFTVPFGGFFGIPNGMLWAQYLETDGAQGIEPPAWTAEMAETIIEWQQFQPGTPESDSLGAALIDMSLEQLLYIGLVKAPAPVYRSNLLGNFHPPVTWSYEYYRMYPYRPAQWWLEG